MELSPLIITLETAVVATVVTFLAGIGLALAVVRMRHFQGLADAIITLPMVLPPTVVGFFLLLFLPIFVGNFKPVFVTGQPSKAPCCSFCVFPIFSVIEIFEHIFHIFKSVQKICGFFFSVPTHLLPPINQQALRFAEQVLQPRFLSCM